MPVEADIAIIFDGICEGNYFILVKIAGCKRKAAQDRLFRLG